MAPESWSQTDWAAYQSIFQLNFGAMIGITGILTMFGDPIAIERGKIFVLAQDCKLLLERANSPTSKARAEKLYDDADKLMHTEFSSRLAKILKAAAILIAVLSGGYAAFMLWYSSIHAPEKLLSFPYAALVALVALPAVLLAAYFSSFFGPQKIRSQRLKLEVRYVSIATTISSKAGAGGRGNASKKVADSTQKDR